MNNRSIMTKLLADLEFQNDEDYYEYIVESEINGQQKQVAELIKELPYKYEIEAYLYILREHGPTKLAEILDTVKQFEES